MHAGLSGGVNHLVGIVELQKEVWAKGCNVMSLQRNEMDAITKGEICVKQVERDSRTES